MTMLDEEDWLLRPVFHRLCSYESLLNGVLTLDDILILNEGLDVQAENEARLAAARRKE